ncbi:MAG TPA: hypothetical protein VKW06_04195 [Candidatus Angelobacter sp.]|nr:hypothetical protein [Candidatus Angelobacter sp.]
MRIIPTVILFCACLSLSAARQRASPTPQENEARSNQQKARAVIDRMIIALGGQAYLTVQDLYSEGRYGRFGHNGDLAGGTVFFRYWQWPDKDRLELTPQRDIVQLYVGDKVYEVTYKGSQLQDPQKDEGVKLAMLRHRYALENVLRTWLNAPGTLLLDEGPTLAINRMAERITIINSSNESVSILVLADSHLPAKKVFYIRDPQSRERDEDEEIYDNWRMVQGVNTPMSRLVQHNGRMARQEYLQEVIYNRRPPDDTFTPKLFSRPKK